MCDFRHIFALVLVACLGATGCKSDQAEKPDLMGAAPTTQQSAQGSAQSPAKSSRKPEFKTQWEETPLPIKQQPVAVAEGLSPLAHIFDVGGPIRIVDLSSNSALVSITIPDRTLVSVSERNGVTIGMKNVVPGPLPAGHRYGIFVDPTTPNVIRQGVGPPGDVPR